MKKDHKKERFISFPPNLLPAIFVERPNRFIVKCRLEKTGEMVEAHLADSGRLLELLIPGKLIYLRKVEDPKRKTKYSSVIVEREDGNGWVSLNAQLPNKLAVMAVQGKLIDSLKEWEYVRSEYTKGHSRWDLLLAHKDGRNMLVEVKGATLVKEGLGTFPDAVTARGTKHVLELAQIQKEDGWETAILFIAQRNDIMSLKPAYHIDPAFGEAMQKAEKAGVKLLGCRADVTLEGIEVTDEIEVGT
ncbi:MULTISPECIES: DNA/RNA nuclease SfsA [Bacillaceae]|uniref:Sugar fermentation stimulation protein homolog n=1 Tax=Evansella alkalicola TaxID=745819 RepID=A0ABS6JUN9_9BACI|nr:MULTISPECIES: DNA/RNA nuclease SfsA [Bacillaceae]MBU9720840.1 DNA/RNA nuclease SfsA [Bacillus alkalicola]